MIGQTIDQKTSVVGALAQNRRCIIAIGVSLTIDRNAWDKLEQIQVISSVDRHVDDFARHDGGAHRRALCFQQWKFTIDLDLLVSAADIELNVVLQSAVQSDFQFVVHASAKALACYGQLIGSGRQRR